MSFLTENSTRESLTIPSPIAITSRPATSRKKYINVGAWDDESNSFKNSWALVENPGVTAQTSAQLVQTTDLIHIRFADVLLMHSELTETADGINMVRERSHLAPVSYSLENLKNERRWELAFESVRWFDASPLGRSFS